jgi:hypothetical protein
MLQPNHRDEPISDWIKCFAGGVLLIVASLVSATTSTDFWLAPPNVSDLAGPPGGEPIYLVVTSGANDASVTVEQPANGAFTPIVFNLGAYASHRVNLTSFKTILESRFTNAVSNNGLHVHATSPVAAVYEVANPTNGEDFFLRGADALGTEFMIPLHRYTPFFNQSYAPPDQAYASFDIVALQSGTTVLVYSPTPVDGHPAMQQFGATLNSGQTLSVGYTGTGYEQPTSHPAGAIVISDKPVAVSIKDDADRNPSGSCYDLIGDQIVPLQALGQDYVAVKGALNNNGDESMVLLATQSDTRIYRNGSNVPEATLFVGETYRIDMDYLAAGPDTAMFVHASHPVYASHVTGIGCEMAMSLLPPLDRGGSRAVDIVRSDAQDFYLLIVVPASAVGDFSLTGAGTATLNSADFRDVPGTAGAWKAARIAYGTTQIPVDTPFHLANASGLFFAATLRGGPATAAFYSWRSDFLADVGLSILLDVSPMQLPEPGGTVTYTVKISNTGTAPARVTALDDVHLGNLQGRGCNLPQDIAVGAIYQCSYSAAVVGNAGTQVDTAVTALSESMGTPLQVQASARVTVLDVPPTLLLAVQAGTGVVSPDGGVVSFDIDVTNTSVESIDLQALRRNGASLEAEGNCTVAGTTIAGAAHYTCTASAIVTGPQGALLTEQFTAIASDDEANSVTAVTNVDVAIDTRIFADDFEQ